MTVEAVLAARMAVLERSGALTVRDTAVTGPGFGAMLEDALRKPIALSQTAETASAAYEAGATDDIAGVELARTEAAIGFQTALQVRNRLLSAYHDVMNMAG